MPAVLTEDPFHCPWRVDVASTPQGYCCTSLFGAQCIHRVCRACALCREVAGYQRQHNHGAYGCGEDERIRCAHIEQHGSEQFGDCECAGESRRAADGGKLC